MDDRKQKLQHIILQAVCEICNFPIGVLMYGDTRKRDFIDARHIASNCLQEYGFHPTEAAEALQRSRVTMLNSRKRYSELYETDHIFRLKADEVKKRIAERLARAQKPMFSAQSVSASIIDTQTDKFYELGEVTPTRPQAQQPTQEDLMRTLKSRQQAADAARLRYIAQKAENDKRRLRECLTEDGAFALTYVPFVIAEVVWDYLDTISDLCQILKIHETKKLSRAVRELRRDYDRERFKIINSDWRKGETENMIMFQEELKDFFNDLHKRYNEAIVQTYGEMSLDWKWLLSAVYGCDTVMKSLYRYMAAQEKVVSAILGYQIAPILPKELNALRVLITEFAGDKPLPESVKELQKKKVEELAQFMGDIGINKTD